MEVLAEVVVGKVFDMIVQPVAHEVALVVNFREDFEWLKNKIEEINAFLRDADEEQRKKQKTWLQKVRDVAWQAQDIFEECDVEFEYGNITQSCILSCNELILRYKLARRIKGVKGRLSSIIDENRNPLKASYPIKPGRSINDEASSSTSEIASRRRSPVLPSDSHPVGMQTKLDKILSLLDSSESHVIAVVGMGGLGKTYLLQNAYNSIREGRYDKSIWLSVSQSYTISKLQRDLACHLNLSEKIVQCEVSETAAADLINRRLKIERSSLIVLDDVWSGTRENDLLANLGLPTGKDSPCKIVVTTRSKEVAQRLQAKIYDMEYLSDEDSWTLFRFYAFEEGITLPPRFEEVARKVVKKCGNLPLAIKTTASSLKPTTNLSDWEFKLQRLEDVVSHDEYPIMDVLKISYDPLPSHLKECFAYLSFFPDNENIDCEYLINLWIAEGFIQAGEDQLEYTAFRYLNELANLCLVEVYEEVEELQGILMIKYCRVHDLLLDLARKVSKDNKCVFSVKEAFPPGPSMQTSGDWCRILLANKVTEGDAISQSRHVYPRLLRTLSLCSTSFLTNIPANFFNTMTVLRVLDLSKTGISTLPECVGKMKLLKVLNLNNTAIEEVPESVRNLKSLWFLDISATPAQKKVLPVWMSVLKRLQHLLCGYSDRMPKEISNVVSLHTLRSDYLNLSIGEGELLRLEDVANMTKLREIKINVKHEVELTTMAQEISRLVKMRHLGVRNVIPEKQGDTELVLAQFPEQMKAMVDLERLELCDFAVPVWICCFQKLMELRLIRCHCSNYPELETMDSLVLLKLEGNKSCRVLPRTFGNSPGFSQLRFLQIKNFDLLEEIPELQTISSLVSLKVEGIKSCRELPEAFGNSSGFPQLRFLKISGFPLLEKFPELHNGAMARLEKFQLLHCNSVRNVEGLERLRTLKEFSYNDTGTTELRRALKEGGEYWQTIRHRNPNVILSGGVR